MELKDLQKQIFSVYLHSHYSNVLQFIGAISSAGSEHLVYTEGVGGSNPSSPTKIKSYRNVGFFVLLIFISNHKKNPALAGFYHS